MKRNKYVLVSDFSSDSEVVGAWGSGWQRCVRCALLASVPFFAYALALAEHGAFEETLAAQPSNRELNGVRTNTAFEEPDRR